MKKLLFIIPSYLHGGTNKSLQNILLSVDRMRYDIRIYSIFDGGVYKKVFSKFTVARGLWIKILFSHKLIPTLISRLSPVLYDRIIALIFKKEAMRISREERPDVVISFEEGIATLFGFFFEDVYKVAWVQCDYAQYVKNSKKKNIVQIEEGLYSNFNRIVCVSKSTMQSMVSIFPRLCNNIAFSYNMLDVENTKKMSEETISDSRFDTTVFSILSIGRFEAVKRFDRIPSIVNNILQHNPRYSFRWYIIAPDGGDTQKTQDEVIQLHLENYVVFLGGKSNPYPYIKNANLVVCLSESESWSYVLNEAKMLHTPVVTTNFDAAYEVVDNSVGVITSIEELENVLFKLIQDESGEYSTLKRTTNLYHYSNKVALEQFDSIMKY